MPKLPSHSSFARPVWLLRQGSGAPAFLRANLNAFVSGNAPRAKTLRPRHSRERPGRRMRKQDRTPCPTPPASLLARRGGLPVRHQFSSGSRHESSGLPRILRLGSQRVPKKIGYARPVACQDTLLRSCSSIIFNLVKAGFGLGPRVTECCPAFGAPLPRFPPAPPIRERSHR